MSSAKVIIPNIQVQLTVEQLINAARQLEPGDRAKLARALADTDLDRELRQLITDLHNQPPVEEISDEDILAEIRASRRQHS